MEQNCTKLSKARLAAYETVKMVSEHRAFVRDVLEKMLAEYHLSESDKAFASKLALGVVQTRFSLEKVIRMCVKSPDDIKRKVMDALCVSTYEIVYLEKEHHAAVDQGVELVKFIEPRAKGLANLVLRRVILKAKEFPFGNPENNIEAFSTVYSLPVWLSNQIIEDMGQQYGKSLIASSNGQPMCYLFVNSIKADYNEVYNILKESKAEPKKMTGLNGMPLDDCILIKKPSKLRLGAISCLFAQGKVFVCDSASQAVVEYCLLACNSPKNMLEICAGKGNKSIMFQAKVQEKWNYQLDLCVLDKSDKKIEILKKRSKNCGVYLMAAMTGDAVNKDKLHDTLSKEFGGFIPDFDFVFADVPCSGLGTLRRHPEIKSGITRSKISDLAKQALQILINAASYVTLGGHLGYATCTITKAENQKVCEEFLKTQVGKNFRPRELEFNGEKKPFYSTFSIAGFNDAHYACVFKRIS